LQKRNQVIKHVWQKNHPQKNSGLFALLGRAADLAADIGFGKVGIEVEGDGLTNEQ